MGQTGNVDRRGKRSHAARLPLPCALGLARREPLLFFRHPINMGRNAMNLGRGLPPRFVLPGRRSMDKKAKSKKSG